MARWRVGVLKATSGLRQLFGRRWESSRSQGESHLVPDGSETPPPDVRGLFSPPSADGTRGGSVALTSIRKPCSSIFDKTLPKNIFGEFKIPEAIGFSFSADQIMSAPAVSVEAWDEMTRLLKSDALLLQERLWGLDV